MKPTLFITLSLLLCALAKGKDFRLPVTVEKSMPANSPVVTTIDFNSLDGVNASEISRASIRVTADDKSLPCHVSFDMESTGIVTIAWRSTDSKQPDYTIHFGSQTDPENPRVNGPIGIGDTFHYNNGQTGLANITPLHSQFLHLDWDGDGLRDFVGWSFRFWEYEVELEHRLGNAVYFLKNVQFLSAHL